jgi:hypothetical protein
MWSVPLDHGVHLGHSLRDLFRAAGLLSVAAAISWISSAVFGCPDEFLQACPRVPRDGQAVFGKLVDLPAAFATARQLRTSDATTAKPLPASPARAPRWPRSGHERLVWLAISSMIVIFRYLPHAQDRLSDGFAGFLRVPGHAPGKRIRLARVVRVLSDREASSSRTPRVPRCWPPARSSLGKTLRGAGQLFRTEATWLART